MKVKDKKAIIILITLGLLFILFSFFGGFSLILFLIGAFLLIAGISDFLPSKKNTDDNKNHYTFDVAGVSYRQHEIRELCWENEDYSLSTQELSKWSMTDEPIYMYEDAFGSVSLVPDPDNEYDENAIKVMRRDILLGFVPKDSTDAMHKILAGSYEATAKAYAGPYKIIHDGIDGVTVENEDQNVGLRVTITYE